jgi:hypothetical protein
VASPVVDTDKGWQSLMDLAGADYTIEVGSSKTYATYVENGTPKMPARSFLRWTFDSKDYVGEWVAKVDDVLAHIGKKNAASVIRDHAKRLAKKIADDVRVTILCRGMIKSGDLLRSISYEVTDNNGAMA